MEHVQIGGQALPLRRWPLKPGLRFARAIGVLLQGSLAKVDWTSQAVEDLLAIDLSVAFSDENIEIAAAMVFEGLGGDEGRDKIKALVERMSLEEFCEVLPAVVKHNLVFLKDRLAQMMKSSGPSTTPQPSLSGSASPSRKRSTASPATK